MPIRNYSILKGKASALALDDDSSPHVEVRIEAAGASYRIAVNARSSVHPHDLLYRKQDPFAHPLLAQLVGLPVGLTSARGRPELALDYVRGNFVQRDAMEVAPFQHDGPHNDLRDYLEPTIEQGIADDSIAFYAFGEPWGPEPRDPDQYFGFLPGRGIHDIHMNQGSSGSHQSSNGVNQDGALLIHFGAENRWAAVFLAFQSQSWSTDATTGHPVADGDGDGERPPVAPLSSSVRIVAALVNPVGGEDGKETVTLLNRTDGPVDLAGWQLADRIDRRQTLTGLLAPGEARCIHLTAAPNGPKLTNNDARIVLLAPDGTVSDQVAYTKADAKREGWTVVF
jgi:uncharacterized protein YukJ